MKTIQINHQPVELYKILKFENLVSGGGEAKIIIANGMVTVNGQTETQKRKQINAGDTILFDGETYQVVLASVDQQPAATPKPPVKTATGPSPAANNSPAETAPVSKPKRSTIRF